MPDLRALIQALTPSVPLPQGLNTATTAMGIDAAGDVLVYEPPDVVVFQGGGQGGPFLPLDGSLPMAGPLSMDGHSIDLGGGFVRNLINAPQLPTDASNKAYVDGAIARAGGPFLPTSGGQMTGALNLVVTGTTATRSVQDRFAEVIDVKDFGATGNGTIADDAAVQAALNAVPSGGATVWLPTGTYLMRNTLRVKSNTRIVAAAGAVLLADTTWTGTEHAFIQNASHNYPTNVTPPIVQTDQNITIEGLTFDYGTFVNVVTGAKHAIFFTFVNHVLVRDCVFYGRDTATNPPASPAADACAMPGCANVRLENCRAYNFLNCFYDFWIGATNIAVVGCYVGALSTAQQIINFNPDTDGADPNLVCDGFQLIGNTLVCTGSSPGVVLISPLNPNCTAQNITVSDNIFDNVYVNFRGDTRAITIIGNVTRNLLSAPAFDGYPNQGGTPAGVAIVANAILDPATAAGNGGVIRCMTDDAVITGNAITGTAFGGTPGIFTATFMPQVFGNYVSNGVVSSPGGLQTATWLTIAFNSGNLVPPGGNAGALAWNSSAGDAELAFWNNVTSPGASHSFWQRTGVSTEKRLFDILPTGNVQAHGALASLGTSSNASDLLTSGLQIGSNAYGMNYYGGQLNLIAGAGGAVNFNINGVSAGYINQTGVNTTAIGAQVPAAGAFTTLSASGALTANGTLQANSWMFAAYNAGNLVPPATNAGAFCWNASGGGAEVDYFNAYTGTPGASHTFWQRTGVGTATRLLDIGPTGGLVDYGANITVGAPGAATITAGTTVPSAAMPAGSIYLHTGGASGGRLYVSAGGGTWNAVAGV